MNAVACCAISSIEVGTSPLELGTPGLLNQIYCAVLCKSVGQRGIPVIHGSAKVHEEEEQRDVDRYPDAAVGKATVREANANRLNELGRCGLVRVVIIRNLRLERPWN